MDAVWSAFFRVAGAVESRPPSVPATATTAGTAEPKPKAKGKAKSNKKGAGGTDNPVATWDVRKAKLSTLEKLPFPVVHRGETRRLFETALLAKAGSLLKLCALPARIICCL